MKRPPLAFLCILLTASVALAGPAPDRTGTSPDRADEQTERPPVPEIPPRPRMREVPVAPDHPPEPGQPDVPGPRPPGDRPDLRPIPQPRFEAPDIAPPRMRDLRERVTPRP